MNRRIVISIVVGLIELTVTNAGAYRLGIGAAGLSVAPVGAEKGGT